MSRGYSIVALCSPKYEENVGGALRAAQAYGAAMVVCAAQRFRHRASDTGKAHRHVPLLTGWDDPLLVLPHECEVVVVERWDWAKQLPEFKHPERAMYVFGPEDGSVDQGIKAMAHHIVQVPTRYCMNLAATVNVVLYDRLAKEVRR